MPNGQGLPVIRSDVDRSPPRPSGVPTCISEAVTTLSRAGCVDGPRVRSSMNSGTVCVVLQLVAKCCQGGSGDFVKGNMTDHVARTARTEALIAQLLEVVHELELMHPGRKFPLD